MLKRWLAAAGMSGCVLENNPEFEIGGADPTGSSTGDATSVGSSAGATSVGSSAGATSAGSTGDATSEGGEAGCGDYEGPIDPFSFPDTIALPDSSINSATRALSGLSSGASACVRGEGDPVIIIDGVNLGAEVAVSNGMRIGVRLTAAPIVGTAHTATVTLGESLSQSWTVTSVDEIAPPAEAISAGGDHACAIRSDGTAWCWGSNGTPEGRLGYGLNAPLDLPSFPVATDDVSGTLWIALGGGRRFHCGIRDDGTLWCWGGGGSGGGAALGYGGARNKLAPVQVSTAGVSGSAWTAIGAMSRDHACALRDSGHIYCWGSGAQGRLGNGGTNDQFTPVQVDVTGVSGEAWTVVSAGGRRHSCALRDDGTAWCWGWNTTGQLGSGVTSTEELTPVKVTTASVSGSSWTMVAAGHRHSCGVRDDGTGWCWGWNEFGQLGNGDNLDQHAPAALSTVGVSGSSWIRLSPAGVNDDDIASRHTCGLRDDGTAWCWGDGTDGRLGTGTSDIVNTPTKLDDGAGSGSSWIAIQASYRNGCGLRADRTLWCWGSGASAIGTGEASSGTNSTPLRVDESLLPPGTAWGY